MNLYEVIRWGNDSDDVFTGGPNGPDTCFLVRSHTVEQAAALADIELSKMRSTTVDNWASAVHHLGTDASTDTTPRVIRGPYVQHAYCHGWSTWHRNSADEGWTEVQRASAS